MPGRNRIPIEHRERIVRGFKDEAEDYLLEADTLGVNGSMARGIAPRYIREGRTRERPRGGRNNVLVDDQMRELLEDIINEMRCYSKPHKWRVEAKTSRQTSDS